jgi:hypothetical protein
MPAAGVPAAPARQGRAMTRIVAMRYRHKRRPRRRATAAPGAVTGAQAPVARGVLAPMSHQEGHQPGDQEPATGHCEELNIFGTPMGRVIHVPEGETLLHAPRGFTWRPVRRQGADRWCAIVQVSLTTLALQPRPAPFFRATATGSRPRRAPQGRPCRERQRQQLDQRPGSRTVGNACAGFIMVWHRAITVAGVWRAA